MCLSFQSWAARNPAICVPCGFASCSVMWLLLYSIFIIVEYQRVEMYQETKCSIQSFDMKQRDCSIQICTGASTTCQTLSTQCWSCRYYATLPSREGLPLIGNTDLTENFQKQEDAAKACQATVANSPIPCFYEPKGNPNMRFLISLTRPTVTTSMIPIVGFGATVILCSLAACCGSCKVAANSREVSLERMYTVARQRAMDSGIRQARWTELAREQEEWENDLGRLPPSASPTGPAPRVSVPQGSRQRALQSMAPNHGPGGLPGSGPGQGTVMVTNPLRPDIRGM